MGRKEEQQSKFSQHKKLPIRELNLIVDELRFDSITTYDTIIPPSFFLQLVQMFSNLIQKQVEVDCVIGGSTMGGVTGILELYGIRCYIG